MSFIYREVAGLQNTPKVGTKECVALIQHYRPDQMNHLKRVIVMALGLAPLFASASEVRMTCPASVAGTTVAANGVPKGWEAYVAGPFLLRSAGPMDGPPAEMAVLKEAASTRRSGSTTVRKWDLEGVFKGGKWMACNYGRGNEIYLSRRLDDATRECTVTRKEQGATVDINIVCTR
jgi:hypothetical protein